MGTLFLLLFGTFTGLLPTFIVALVVFNIVKAIVKSNKKRRTPRPAASQNNPIIYDLQNYFRNNSRLQLEDDIYIEPSDPDDIQLTNLNIFMHGEFIATLADYRTAFPNAFTAFSQLLRQTVKNSAAAPAGRQAAPAAPVQPAFSKDAQYYINQLTQLNEAIPEEKISQQLDMAVDYLKDVKKIEDTYPDAKEKTRKLYQYYLPMLTDILANYKQLAASSSANQAEFKASEDRLLKTVVLINGALKTISSSLLQEHYTDLSVNMKTLEAVLKKDGLVDDGLTKAAARTKDDDQVVNSND